MSEREPIIVEAEYPVSPERVWSALTTAAEMRKWFFAPMAEFEPKVGFWTRFDVDAGSGKIYTHVWRVTEVLPQKRLTLEWQYAGFPGDSYATFELSANGASTKLRLTHDKQDSFPQTEEVFTRESCTAGWRYFIADRLAKYLARQE